MFTKSPGPEAPDAPDAPGKPKKPSKSGKSGSPAVLTVFGFLGLFAVLWLAAATTLMLMVGVVHVWWPTVPTMPFTVALILSGIQLLAAGISGGITETWKAALR